MLILSDKWAKGIQCIESAYAVPSRILQKMGLSLQNVYIEGREKTSPQEILNALHLQRGDYIFKVNLKDSYDHIKKLKWVRSVMIERRLPSTLYIRLVEKKPLAFWQHQHKFYLIDTLGNIICESPRKEFPNFIVVTGENAPKALPQLLGILNQYPTIRDQTCGAMYIGQRRWDLVLKHGMCIKLPETGVDKSCQLLTKLINDKRLDNPAIQEVDLRHNDRIYFYLKDFPKQKAQKEEKNA
jgi:cell division protein FtsQ